MEIDPIALIIIGVGIVVIVAVWLWLYNRMRKVDLTSPPTPNETPPWINPPPPPETEAATRADGEEGAVWDYDPDEQVAAPFAEQIEDMIRARIKDDPTLAVIDFDLGTAEDGSLEFWVDGQPYTDIADLPHEQLRRAMQEALDRWQQYMEKAEE